jgi:heme/copper-type cytochrome/quinol oxidase subunit 2
MSVLAKLALFFPAWVFPLIAAFVFVVLGVVVWSFRDVSNRHSQKTGGSAASGHATDH